MSKLRRYIAAIGLTAALSIGTTALASPRPDGCAPGDLVSRVRSWIVKVMEDIRANFPPG